MTENPQDDDELDVDPALLERMRNHLFPDKDYSHIPGIPPKDFPEEKRTEYADTWKELARTFSADQIEAFIEGYRTQPDSFPIPGIVEDVKAFMKRVGHLARVRWALTLNHNRALVELAGEDAARGRKVIAGASDGGKGRATPKGIKDKWINDAIKKWERNPKLSARDVAAYVEQDTTKHETVRKLIAPYKPSH